MHNFVEYLKNRDPQLFDEIVDEGAVANFAAPFLYGLGAISAVAPYVGPVAAGAGLLGAGAVAKGVYNYLTASPEKLLKKGELIISKKVIPHNLIMGGRENKEKFSRDVVNLESDPSSGMAMSGLTKPKTLLVVTDEAMQRLAPGMGAAASGDYIFMPAHQFVRLPTATDDGELNDAGKKTLAHEAGHTTQNQNLSKGLVGDDNYDKYMNSPAEMGVRLGALKNYMDVDILGSMMPDGAEKNALLSALPMHELGIFENVMDYESWAARAADESGLSVNGLRGVAKNLRAELSGKNHDVDTLLSYYDSLDGSAKADYLNRLKAGYNTVVRGAGKNVSRA